MGHIDISIVSLDPQNWFQEAPGGGGGLGATEVHGVGGWRY